MGCLDEEVNLPNQGPEEIVAAVRKSTQGWSEEGGRGEIYYDVASRYLAILQTRAAQESIARELERLSKSRNRVSAKKT